MSFVVIFNDFLFDASMMCITHTHTHTQDTNPMRHKNFLLLQNCAVQVHVNEYILVPSILTIFNKFTTDIEALSSKFVVYYMCVHIRYIGEGISYLAY